MAVPFTAVSLAVAVGLAKILLQSVPVPDNTPVDDAWTHCVDPVMLVASVPVKPPLVKLPDPGVVLPIAPGAANVAPFRLDAFRFATFVVDAITKGAVPVVNVEVSWPLSAAAVVLIGAFSLPLASV